MRGTDPFVDDDLWSYHGRRIAEATGPMTKADDDGTIRTKKVEYSKHTLPSRTDVAAAVRSVPV